MKSVSRTTIFLRRLSLKEKDEVFQLSQQAIVFGNFFQDLQLQGEQPTEFVQRLLWLSKGLYAICLQQHPEKTIGYTLYYKSGKSFQNGLCILPGYYHPLLVDQVRDQIAELAKFCYGIKDIGQDKVISSVDITPHYEHLTHKLAKTLS